MRGKIFSPNEVDRMLPLVSRIADDLVAAYGSVNDALQAFQAEETRAKAAPDREPQLDAANDRVGKALDGFQRLIEELEALGGTLRDYERGSVDFYGEVDGEIVYLCWQRGEQHVSHWHRLDEGFTRRRPLVAGAAA
jgi:hypothetical protein